MKANWMIAAGTLVFGLAAHEFRSGAKPSDTQSNGVQWRTSLPQAMQEARRTGKPLLLELGTSSCMPCRMMDQSTWTHPKVVAETRKWIPVRVDIMQSPAVGEKYNAPPVPKIVFLHPNGKVANGVRGYRDPARMLRILKATYPKSC